MDDILLKLIKLKTKGFCCSQMIMILALEAQRKTNIDLVRSLGGLCFGINGLGEVCGALTGGACLISLYTGKGDDEEEHNNHYLDMIDELVAWFGKMADEEYGGIRCGEILEKYPDRGICGQIVADTYGKCMKILEKHGVEPAAGKNG